MEDEEKDPLFKKHWDELINSLDVLPEKAIEMEHLPFVQKQQLVDSFLETNPKGSAFHYVTLIKGMRIRRSTFTKRRLSMDENEAKRILVATEISLRTNSVLWVYDFLKHDGLNVLVEYVVKGLEFLLRSKRYKHFKLRKPRAHRWSDTHRSFLLNSGHPLGDSANTDSWRSFLCGNSVSTVQSSLDVVNHSDALLDCVHQAVRCFRALLNTQRGCENFLQHPSALDVLTLCLIHPSYQTKSLVLELLTAICLIILGHERVLQGFDNLKSQLGEFNRFECLAAWLKSYESQNALESLFPVTCVQFFNVMVHSTKDIMLRVVLQEELRHLGIMDFLNYLLNRIEPGRLTEQIKTFNANEVNVATLLEDSQKLEQLLQDMDLRETEILSLQTMLGNLQSEHAVQTTELRSSIAALQARCAELEQLKQIPVVSNKSSAKETVVSTSDAHGDSITSVSTSSAPLPPPPSVPHRPSAPSVIIPPPPPPPGSASATNKSIPIRPPLQTRFRLPHINLVPLPERLLHGTIFRGMNDVEVLNHIDLLRLEELFKLSDQSVRGGILTKGQNSMDIEHGRPPKKPEKKSLMDSNRHRCFGVLSRFLDSENCTRDSLHAAIARLDVSQDVADRICHHLPTQEERTAYLKYEFTDQLDVNQLTDEDQLLLTLCKVPRLSERLQLVLLMHSFDDSFGKLFQRLSVVHSVSLELRKSERFRAVLEVILAHNNYFNSSRRGVVYGFRLNSLNALTNIRSLDRSCTLLHFIVETIECAYPALYDFYTDLGDVAAAARVPMEVLTADVAALVTGMQLAEDEAIIYGPEKVPEILTNFIRTNKPRVESMKQLAENAKTEFQRTTEYFGESQHNPSPEIFFAPLSQFIDDYKKAQVYNENRRKAEALRELQQVTEPFDDVSLPKNSSLSSIKKPKNISNMNIQRNLVNEARRERSRMNRTRQITGDGIMDEILASLNSEPLQAEVHPRRARQPEVSG